MRTFNHNKVFRGSFGKLYVDGERLSNVKSFEAKVSIDYEDVIVNGYLGTKKRPIGYSISGTMTLHKFDSFILNKYKDALRTGDFPDITMDAIMDDPTAYGRESIRLNDVTFDEITLSKFENKTMTEEEVPFAAGEFDVGDTIE